MYVVHVAFECAPIYKTGGLGDVVGSLPVVQARMGIQTAVVMPGYSFIKKLDTLPESLVPVHYVSGEYFDLRIKGKNKRLQAEAFAFFCEQTLKLLENNEKAPDIIHCHDWHAALIPFFIKTVRPEFFTHTKTIVTIHNSAYQGKFPRSFFSQSELKYLFALLPKKEKQLSFLQLGIFYADYLSTVSPNHAKEIIQGKVDFGLTKLIKKRRKVFTGIINGLDYRVWNPHTDQFLRRQYNNKTVMKGKKENKLGFQKQVALEQSADLPLFAFVARLSSQKGVDLLAPLLTNEFFEKAQLFILGTGDQKYELVLKDLARKHKGKLTVRIGFDEKMAHQAYAAADFFLIPSHYEPCGLTQMISMAYGAIPVASAVGGLKDTIKHNRTGILFRDLTSLGLSKAVTQALSLWEQQAVFSKLQSTVMHQDFSWEKSAKKYIKLYRKVVNS